MKFFVFLVLGVCVSGSFDPLELVRSCETEADLWLGKIIECCDRFYHIHIHEFNTCTRQPVAAFISQWRICQPVVQDRVCKEMDNGKYKAMQEFTSAIVSMCCTGHPTFDHYLEKKQNAEL